MDDSQSGLDFEEIIHKLHEADVLLGRGKSLAELEAVIARFRLAVTTLAIDKLILKEVAQGKVLARCIGGKRICSRELVTGSQRAASAGRWVDSVRPSVAPANRGLATGY